MGGLSRRRRRKADRGGGGGGGRTTGPTSSSAGRRNLSFREEENKTDAGGQAVDSHPASAEAPVQQREEEAKVGGEEREFPEILVTGLHHAREPLSMLMCLYLIGKREKQQRKSMQQASSKHPVLPLFFPVPASADIEPKFV